MPFNLRKDARKWFSELRGNNGFKIDFDSYYFCFIAGITAQKKTSIPSSEVAELVDYFPGKYSTKGKLLVALFLSQELESLGIDMSDKRSVNNEISKLVQPNSSSGLSVVGTAEFNKYAHGGYEILLEWFDDKPRNLATFLRTFKSKLDQNVTILT